MRLLVHCNKNVDALTGLARERFGQLEIRGCKSYDELLRILPEYSPEVLFTIKSEKRPYPRSEVLETSSLRWIAVGGVGVDHIAPWDTKQLTVTNGAGVSSEVMAFYVVGGIIGLTMQFPKFIRQQLSRKWDTAHVGVVSGRRVCVVGLGHIGQAVARLANGLGLHVVGVRARPAPMEHVAEVFGVQDLRIAMKEADYIVITVPLTEDTRGMIDESAIAAMKVGSYLIDVSRGGVVDQGALLKSLRAGKIAGAMLDVFEQEPLPLESEFWDMENVIVTPHTSGIVQDWELQSFDMFCDNLELFLANRPLQNVINPARGY